ncbi:class II fructose-1,6-bisphosphate aldolase [Gilliamella sp. wkB112]|uniref:class II fructose-1,6-bisphosphate aldolase n=1 Tax=Gilliamella sp. wkB112 TaxID=3120257 RepID=UPI00080DE961|nr:class II fructose-1,6-bisphosphate aldolase [Gilliamella apicola]OCG02083.1 fructose-1,6-bisphosphate aldolase, class II [Gilliamella apicola]
MAFVSMTNMLTQAKHDHYAVAQFNINGLLWIQAILETAEQQKTPIIVAVSDRMVEYLGGFECIYQMVLTTQKKLKITVPVALHLDHGATVEHCLQAIDAGFSSVMFDGSHSPIIENIKNTKVVCDYAKNKGVSVEAEVGTVGGNEDGLIGGINYADFDECIKLVEETKVNALAAALGSVHGKYSGSGPKLGFKEMERLNNHLTIPLVLHGASGIPVEQLKKCIQLGHAKINFNTELVTTWADSVRKTIQENPQVCEPRLIMLPAKQALIEKMTNIIQIIGSANRI